MEHTRERTELRIAVLGTGANGAAIGVDLVRAGRDVTFIDQWPENVEAIKRAGVRVELDGAETVTQVRIHHLYELAALRAEFDVVLLLVKAYDTRWACELIKPYLSADGVVVGVQNGMTTDAIADVVGGRRTLGAVIEITSAMYTPGVVERHSSHERSWFAVGPLHPEASLHVEKVATVLRHVGVVETTDDIQSAKWMKLILNAAELVPSAILDLSIFDCASYPGMRELMVEAGNEAVRAAQIDGATIRPIFGMAETSPESFVEEVLGELLANYVLTHSRSTVLQDWIKSRHSEVDELNGHVVDTLLSKGEPAHVNAAIVDIAHAIERGDLDRGIHLVDRLLDQAAERSPRNRDADSAVTSNQRR